MLEQGTLARKESHEPDMSTLHGRRSRRESINENIDADLSALIAAQTADSDYRNPNLVAVRTCPTYTYMYLRDKKSVYTSTPWKENYSVVGVFYGQKNNNKSKEEKKYRGPGAEKNTTSIHQLIICANGMNDGRFISTC